MEAKTLLVFHPTTMLRITAGIKFDENSSVIFFISPLFPERTFKIAAQLKLEGTCGDRLVQPHVQSRVS